MNKADNINRQETNSNRLIINHLLDLPTYQHILL